jgi:hypothetical protein
MSDISFPTLTSAISGFSISSFGYDFISTIPNTTNLILDLSAYIDDSYPNSGLLWNDISGSENNALLTSGTPFDGYGLVFSGGKYGYISNSPNFDFSGDFTIECWFKQIGTSGPVYPHSLISSWDGVNDPDNSFSIFIFSNNTVDLAVNPSGTDIGINHHVPITNGTWNHVVGIRRNGYLEIYLNGVKSTETSPLASGTIDSVLDIQIGKYQGSPTDSFNGSIGRIRVYNGLAFTETQVRDSYRNTYIEDSIGTVSINDFNIGESALAVPGYLTGRRPSEGQVFPRGVYNK